MIKGTIPKNHHLNEEEAAHANRTKRKPDLLLQIHVDVQQTGLFRQPKIKIGATSAFPSWQADIHYHSEILAGKKYRHDFKKQDWCGIREIDDAMGDKVIVHVYRQEWGD